jgi:XTP/dITP diphosphohydrolase
MQTIVLASGNPGKLQELQQLVAPLYLDVVLQRKLGVEDAEETGLTFVENAILKARHACQHTGLAALADDSGLEVDALQGRPGIYSARYSGADATDLRNNHKLLEELRDVPDMQRSARYHCVLVLLRHAQDPCPLIAQGSWEGRILHQPRGTGGFGYDPLFLVPEHDCSAAELPAGLKGQLSHRAQAMASLLTQLQQRNVSSPA